MHIIIYAGSFRSSPDFLIAGLGHTERNIVTHGNIKKLRVLKYKRDMLVESIWVDVTQIYTPNTDPALVRVSKARNQCGQGGLTRARRTHQRSNTTFGHAQTYMV